MKNTGITYTSAERSPVILPEMAELLPPLSAEQSAALEEDLLRNGCYSPIIVNEDMVIVDGHNRQSLCEKHGLPYTMAVFSFEDLLEAKQWALDTQKGRRNLEKWELGKIALKLKPEIEAKARANQGTRTDLSATLPESSDTVDTRKELAEAVGLGERTMGKVMQIDENAPEVIKEALDMRITMECLRWQTDTRCCGIWKRHTLGPLPGRSSPARPMSVLFSVKWIRPHRSIARFIKRSARVRQRTSKNVLGRR